jgi:hypothetical protein
VRRNARSDECLPMKGGAFRVAGREISAALRLTVT